MKRHRRSTTDCCGSHGRSFRVSPLLGVTLCVNAATALAKSLGSVLQRPSEQTSVDRVNAVPAEIQTVPGGRCKKPLWQLSSISRWRLLVVCSVAWPVNTTSPLHVDASPTTRLLSHCCNSFLPFTACAHAYCTARPLTKTALVEQKHVIPSSVG